MKRAILSRLLHALRIQSMKTEFLVQTPSNNQAFNENVQIQNTEEIKRALFNWTKQDKTCKFSRKSSCSSYVQCNWKQLNQRILCQSDESIQVCYMENRADPLEVGAIPVVQHPLCLASISVKNMPEKPVSQSFVCGFARRQMTADQKLFCIKKKKNPFVNEVTRDFSKLTKT